MPIYEYKCTACDHRLEKLQRMSDNPLVDCPECEKPELTKLVSAAGFRLKGNGWYETDFKNKKPDTSTKSSTETTPKLSD
jgi:putative FmdB family regulatory protein